MASKAGRAQGAPEPSLQVLSLVSSFLSENGFESTNKALRKELKRKNQTTDLEAPQDGVRLEGIVESWNKQEAQSSSSEDESSEESAAATSESGSDSNSVTSSEAASEAESESESEEEAIKTKPLNSKRAKVDKRATSPAASSSSSSDSDADDEDEDGPKAKSARKKSSTSATHTESVRSRKRRAPSSSPEASSSESDSSENDRPAKRTKVAIDREVSSSEGSSVSERESSGSDAAASKSGEDDSSDADTSSSEDELDGDDKSKPAQPNSVAKLITPASKAPSDSSSNTVMGDVVEPEENSGEPGGSRSVNNKDRERALGTKKHVGARPTPLAQLSAHATEDSHISNAYQSYDYADRAYNDLSVTRGKGFTKEKNKKKRGSYRGGAIDISGGKSFKFDD